MTPSPETPPSPDLTVPEIPRYYSNAVNLAVGAYDMTLTFLEADPTALPEGQVGPHAARIESRVQIVMALGHAKAILPLIVKAISGYEQLFGIIPAPGFDTDASS